MNWDDMRILEVCARAGSFAKAGKELQLNHSSISRRMTQLENELGVILIERRSTGIHLTKAGRVIAAQAVKMASSAMVAQNAAEATSRLSGQVRFQTVDATAYNLMDYLQEFSLLYPNIEIDLVLSQDFANLARGEADVVLRVTDKPTDTYIGQRIGHHAVGVFGTSTLLHRFPDGTPLNEFPWVLWSDGLTDWWIDKHMPGAKVAMRVNTPHGMTEAIKSGVGVGHLACYGVAQDSGFLCLRSPDPELALQIWLLAHRNVRRNSKVRLFMGFIREKIRKDLKIIEGQSGSPRHALQLALR